MIAHIPRRIRFSALALPVLVLNLFGQKFEFGADAGVPLYPVLRNRQFLLLRDQYVIRFSNPALYGGSCGRVAFDTVVWSRIRRMYRRIGYADTVDGYSPTNGLYYYSHAEVAGNSWDSR